MKNYLFASLLLTAIISCEKKSTEIVDIQTTPPDSLTVPESNEPIESSTLQTCYIGNTGKDSIYLTLDDNLGTFTGKLRYKNFEKDSSSGDVMGTQNGDTLKLNYTFASEGMTSDREIFFLRKGAELLEGIGEQNTEGSASNYANPSKLKYEGNTLKQVDCTDFEKKMTAK